jgi:hypothetical protein
LSTPGALCDAHTHTRAQNTPKNFFFSSASGRARARNKKSLDEFDGSRTDERRRGGRRR